MIGRELIEYIVDNDLEDIEILIQPPSVEDKDSESVPLEHGDIEWNDEYLFIG